jgi:hypothetical protein
VATLKFPKVFETSYVALMCSPEEINGAMASQQLEDLNKFRMKPVKPAPVGQTFVIGAGRPPRTVSAMSDGEHR